MIQKRSLSVRWPIRRGAVAAVALALVAASLPASAAGGPALGAARTFAVLGASTVSSTGLTAVTGDVGVSPGTSIVGFPPGTVTSGALHAGDPAAARAHNDAELAYAFLAGMASIPANNRTGVDLGGKTLTPGVYKFNTSAQLTGALTLDAQGDSGALFVLQIGSSLTTSTNASVGVINGGANFDASNVYWQVGSSATLGSGTAFTGNILAYSSISLVAGATMTGNALALHGAVTMDANRVTSPPQAGPPVAVPGAPAAPGNVTAVHVGPAPSTVTQVEWTDTSDNETGFHVFRRDGAGPEFILIGTVPANDVSGTGGVLTYQDAAVDPNTTYTYRVSAFNSASAESVPSNEARIDASVVTPAPTRWLDVELGRGRSIIVDSRRARTDRVVLTGSYSVIDVDTSVPPVVHDVNPRVEGVTIQVGAPGNLVLLAIPANDPRWKASKRGVYVWRTRNNRNAPVSSIRIDTRKSEFTLTSSRNEFGTVPVNAVTVTLTYQGATGSDIRAWDVPGKMPAGTRTLLKITK